MKNAILNAGSGAWAFETLALKLSATFGVPVAQTAAAKNYLLGWDSDDAPTGESFVPFASIQTATDKRETARIFNAHRVPSPATYLCDSPTELHAFLTTRQSEKWLLKWPIGCGGAGHRFLAAGDAIPTDWPRPFVVQKFIAQARPEVFRLYAVAGEPFGWNARRFAGSSASPFVAHARGARYERETPAPPAALAVARAALEAMNLWNSFGCADLLRDENGHWLALEVNTDGRWMHVDRDVDIDGIGDEINARLGHAFRNWCA